VQIRLYGTREENAAAVERLATLFDIVSDSGDRPPRGGGDRFFRYLYTADDTAAGPARPPRTRRRG